MEYYGFCEQERRGKICPQDIRHTRHAISGSSSGSGQDYSNASSTSLHKTCTNEVASIFVKPSLTGPLCRQKRGLSVGKTKRGKGTKIISIADAAGFPVAAHIEIASPHEVKLVEDTIDSGLTQYAPDKLVGDKAYDSDELDRTLLNDRGVELIAPHRRGRKRPKTQDGRKLLGQRAR